MAQALLEFTGQTPGNLIAVLHNGVVIGSAVFSEDESRPAPPDVVRAIEAQSWPDAPPRTEKLGSLGSYRVDCLIEGPDTLVVGVSLNIANRIIARKNITTTALMASALLVTAATHGLGGRLHPAATAPGRRDRRGGRRDAAHR